MTDLPATPMLTLAEIERALRASWAEDTCSPDDLKRFGWQPDNPALGHCDITSLVVNDIFGGEFVVATVHLDGKQHGFHTWNRLESGIEVDLTREQFRLGQVLDVIKVARRPAGPLNRHEEYLLFRRRFRSQLDPLHRKAFPDWE